MADIGNAKSLRVGQVLKGRYRLEALLGLGGMAEVYMARNTLVDRVVAIKILRREMAARPEAVERFMREAKAAGTVRHRNIVDVLDIDKGDDGVMFIVQEYLEGEDLAARIKREGGKLEPSVALDILLPVAEAVGFAHGQGIVHRDLKPDNVFISSQDGEPIAKVLDFGISKLPLHDELRRNAAAASAPRLTAVGAAMGTPYYMSPEQIRDPSSVDARTDVWSLGVVLYEALSGRMPFDADDLSELFGLICSGHPQELARLAPEVPQALARVVHRCLSADPTLRYADGAALASALSRVRSSQKSADGTETGPPASVRSPSARSRRNSGRFRTYDPNHDPRAVSTASIPSAPSGPPPDSDPPPPEEETDADRVSGAPAVPDLELDIPPVSARRPSRARAGPSPPASEPRASAAPSERAEPPDEPALPSGNDWDDDDEDDGLGIELATAPELTLQQLAPTAPGAAQPAAKRADPPPQGTHPPTRDPTGSSTPSPASLPATSRRIQIRRHGAMAPRLSWRAVRALLAVVLLAVVAGSARFGTPTGLADLNASFGASAPLAYLVAAAAMLVGAIWVAVFALRLPAVSLFVATAGLFVTTAASAVAAATLASPGLLPVAFRKALLVAWPWAACVVLLGFVWFAISYARDLGRLGERGWAVLSYLAAAAAFLPLIWLARLDWPGIDDVSRLEVGLTPRPVERTAHQLGLIYEGARALPAPTPLPVDGAVNRGAGAIAAPGR